MALNPANSAKSAKPDKPQGVRIKTSDGWSLTARYSPVERKKAAVVLLHGLAAGKDEWKPLVEQLSKRGVASLAVDLRGHGGARHKGRKRAFETFTDHGPNGEWARLWKDAEAGYRFLLDQGYQRIGVAGASVGANAAARAAAEVRQIDFLVLLSPGIDYQGIRTPEPLESYGPRPLLLVVSRPDQYAFQSCDALRQLRAAGRLPSDWLEAREGHGAQMFRESDVLERVAAWIAETGSGS